MTGVAAPAGPAAAAPAQVGVVRARDEHDPALAAFYRRTWDTGATAASVRAARRNAAVRNPVAPGEAPATFLFMRDQEAIGHLTTLPIHVWDGARERPAVWMKGLMVLPEHRNGPVGFYLVREAAAQVGLALAAVVAPDARRLFSASGFADLGALDNRVRVLRPRRVLRGVQASDLGARSGATGAALRLLRGVPPLTTVAAAALAAASGAAAWRLPANPARVLPRLDPDALTGLWARARRRLSAVPSRDAAYLRHRYLGAHGYRLLGVHDRAGLAAFAAVKPPAPEGDPRLGGIRVAVLSEVIFPPDRPEVGRALLAGAETVAASLDADALLCSASHPVLAALLRRRMYLPFPANVHLMVRVPAGPPLPRRLDAWWLTRGDSMADEAF